MLQHVFLAAAATLRSQRDQAVAHIAEPEFPSVVDPFDHLVVIVTFLAVAIELAMALSLLEVELLQHRLIEDKLLVVAQQQGKRACDHR